MLDTGRAAPPGRMPWSAGEGHGPPAGVCGGAGLPGPMRASAPTRRAAWRGNVVSRLPTGPALGRRGGFHIRPRDLAPPQSPRDDASIVPYRGCNNAGFEISRVAANPPLAVGADSISARGTLRRRGFSGAVAAFSQICRAGVHARRTTAISKWKRSRRRGARRDEGIPPYGRPGGCGQPFWPHRLPWFAGCLRRRRVARADASIGPYKACGVAGECGFPVAHRPGPRP